MRESITLRDTVLRFYDRFSASDVESFELLVSQQANLFIGTAESEWFLDRERLRSGFGYQGLCLEAGDPQAWEEGPVGWAADKPIMQIPRFGAIRTRFTAVFRREEGAWKLVMSHFSVGVPDEEVADLQRRWLGLGS